MGLATAASAGTRLTKKVYDSPEELRLVRRAKRGDETAFNELYAVHRERVYVTIKRMLVDDDASQWVTNSALAKVWEKLNSFKEKSKFSTWITRIAINEALMHIRREKRWHREISLDSLLNDGLSNNSDPAVAAHKWLATRDLDLEGTIDREVLERAFRKVPAQFHEILRLRFWEGFSLGEIREKLSAKEPEPLSMSAVKSRILRGRTMLVQQVVKNTQVKIT